MNRGGLALVLGLLPLGCSHATSEPRPVSAAQPVASVAAALGPGDVFEVRVFGEDELSGIYRVSAAGDIVFPLVGKVQAGGLTAGELSDAIGKGLARYVKNPYVSVFVKEYTSKKVFVFGKVKQPGTFPFEDGMNIIQAITLAGGFDALADEDYTYVTRIVDGQETRLKVSVKEIGAGESPNFILKPGDIVYVPETIF